jgi:hypothetical protein
MVENGTAGKKYLKDWHFVHAFGHGVYEYVVVLLSSLVAGWC